MKINLLKLANAVKYQNKKLTMNYTYNLKHFSTDFAHWAIVRRVRMEMKKGISLSEVWEWLEKST